jgi:hypothetical protein
MMGIPHAPNWAGNFSVHDGGMFEGLVQAAVARRHRQRGGGHWSAVGFGTS